MLRLGGVLKMKALEVTSGWEDDLGQRRSEGTLQSRRRASNRLEGSRRLVAHYRELRDRSGRAKDGGAVVQYDGGFARCRCTHAAGQPRGAMLHRTCSAERSAEGEPEGGSSLGERVSVEESGRGVGRRNLDQRDDCVACQAPTVRRRAANPAVGLLGGFARVLEVREAVQARAR